MTHLTANSGEDEQEGDEDGDEDDEDGDGGDVAGHRRPVAVVVERRTAIRAERVEPALHGGTSPDRDVTRCRNTSRTERQKLRTEQTRRRAQELEMMSGRDPRGRDQRFNRQ